MTLQAINLNPLMRGIADSIKKTKWVRCPSCDSEWSKLKPCAYYWWDRRGKHDDLSYLCADCGENVRGLMFCTQKWPISGDPASLKVDIFWPSDHQPNWYETDAIDPSTGKKYKERMMVWSRLHGRVRSWKFGQMGEPQLDASVHLGKNIAQLSVFLKGAEAPMYFENTIAAWHWIKAKIEQASAGGMDPDSPEDFRRMR